MPKQYVKCSHKLNVKECLTCWPQFTGREDRTPRELGIAMRKYLERHGVPHGDLDQTDLINLKGAMDNYFQEVQQ